MTNLFSGLVIFIIHVGIIFSTIKLPAIANADTAPLWYSILLGLITVLYIYFGYQTSKKENQKLAGGVFYLLALITVFLILMSNARY